MPARKETAVGRRGQRRKWKKKKKRIVRAVIAGGDTFSIKDTLREHGFRWDETERRWWRPSAGFSEESVAWLKSFGIDVEFGARVVV